MMLQREGARGSLSRLEAAVVLRLSLVAIRRNRHNPGGGPRYEGTDAASRQGRGHRDLAGFDLGPVREPESSRSLDTLGEQQVQCPRRVAPEHGGARCSLTLLQSRRFLRLAGPATGLYTELSLPLSAGRDVDPMCMAPTVRRYGFEHDARMAPDQPWLTALLDWRIVVRELAPADGQSRRHQHLVGRHAEPVTEVCTCELIITLIGRRLEQARRVHRLDPSAALDQISAAENLGDAQLGRGEVEALGLHDDVEDRVPAPLDARAIRPRLGPVPAPGRVVIGMSGVWAADVRRAVLPGDPERVEHFRLAAFDRRLKRLGRDVALSHHPLARHQPERARGRGCGIFAPVVAR
jgi:hypothetical protein